MNTHYLWEIRTADGLRSAQLTLIREHVPPVMPVGIVVYFEMSNWYPRARVADVEVDVFNDILQVTLEDLVLSTENFDSMDWEELERFDWVVECNFERPASTRTVEKQEA